MLTLSTLPSLLVRSALLTALLSLTGCASMRSDALNEPESSALQEKTLTFRHYQQTPNFIAQTPVTAQLGPIGFALAIKNGNAMLEENQVIDPALEIAQALSRDLERHHQVQVVANNLAPLESDRLDDLIDHYQGYDYILDVRTQSWMSTYYLTDWNNYRVLYSVQARLIDRQKQTVIAQELCTFMPEFDDPDNAPSYEDLEQGTALAQELKKSTRFCIEHIRSLAKFKSQANTLVQATTPTTADTSPDNTAL